MSRIVCLGSALQDIYLIDRDDFVAAKPSSPALFQKIEIGSKIDIDQIAYQVGGGGTNTAVSFARHGHETIFMGSIARDTAGEAVLACLDQEAVDSSYIHFSSRQNTGCSIVLLDAVSGERTILTHRGASAHFSALDPADLDLIQPDWLYVTTLHGDMTTLLKFFEKAHAIGCKIMFNPGRAELAHTQKLIGLLEEVDILLVNKAEAAAIVPGKVLTELLSRLHNLVTTILITEGSMGAIASNGAETYRLGIYEDAKMKDSTGAGDAFGAGFLAHYSAGHSFKESLIFAAANSTSVITQLGAKAGLLTGQEKLHDMPIQEIEL